MLRKHGFLILSTRRIVNLYLEQKVMTKIIFHFVVKRFFMFCTFVFRSSGIKLLNAYKAVTLHSNRVIDSYLGFHFCGSSSGQVVAVTECQLPCELVQ